jgi:hypothetical protein
MKGLATFHRLPVVLFFSYLRDFYLAQDTIRFDGARCGGSLPPRRGFQQSEIVVSRIWGGTLSFRPRRARNGHAVFSSYCWLPGAAGCVSVMPR